jgi:hypothetical protein
VSRDAYLIWFARHVPRTFELNWPNQTEGMVIPDNSGSGAFWQRYKEPIPDDGGLSFMKGR